MNTVLLCIKGRTEIIPSIKNSKVIQDEYTQIQSLLELDIYSGKKVIIVAAGDNSYHAAKLAVRYEKECYINGQTFNFIKNSKKKLSRLESEVLLTSMSTQEGLFQECSEKLINLIAKQTPSKMSFDDAIKILKGSDPAITLSSRESSLDYLIRSFNEKLALREQKNLSRITVKDDNENIIKIKMRYEEVTKYILDNPGAYALVAPKGFGKTKVALEIYECCTQASIQTLMMTSTITLTNALCNDERNYRNVIANNAIGKTKAIASCLYTALMNPSFKEYRENSKVAIIEEYESCRDAILADIVGRNGTLEEKASAQLAFNKTIKDTETLIITDAHLSQQSADHFVKRTGKKLTVIEPIFEHKRETKKLTYFVDRNVAIQNIRNTIDDNKRAFTMSDCQHDGKKSKFRVLDIAIKKGFDIKNIAIDADFFAEGDNLKHMQDPTAFVNKYDHVLSTSVWKNGVSIFSGFDLTTLICHQTIGVLDASQCFDRDRLNINKALYVRDVPTEPQISWTALFEQELKKGLLSVEVDDKRKLLKNNVAARDVIDRIKHNNEMRLDYANNLLCIMKLQGYELQYNYEKATKELKKLVKGAESNEYFERLAVYKTLDKVKQASKLKEIEGKSSELRTLDEKRLSYASEVAEYYNLKSSAKDEEIKDVFNFDEGGHGRTKISNFKKALSKTDSEYYVTQARKIILRKLFDCLGLDGSLTAEFSKQNHDEFFDFLLNEQICFGTSKEKAIDVFKSIFPQIKITTSTWVVKNLLLKEFGLGITEVVRNTTDENGEVIKESKPTVRNKNSKKVEYLMCISQKSADNLLKFYNMSLLKKVNVDNTEWDLDELAELNEIAKGENENQQYFYERVLLEVI